MMARSRNIKPGFFANEDLASLEPHARLLFAGLWTLADKNGILEDRPKRIHGAVFPYEPQLEVHRYLTELSRLNFISRYTAEHRGEKIQLIKVLEWAEHQRPHHTEKESIFPDIDQALTDLTVNSPFRNRGNPPDSLIPDSQLLPPSLRSGGSHLEPYTPSTPTPENPTPGKVEKANGSPKKRLPADFAVSARVQAWAAEHGFGDLDAHLDTFRLKAIAKGYKYADWDAAFMGAIREDWAGLRKPSNASANSAIVHDFLTSKGLKA